MALFGPKTLRIEVTEGVDIESGLTLGKGPVRIGTGPDDDLVLGSPGVAAGHLTIEPARDGKGWEYFSSDRAATEVDRGNPRTGKLRAGMWFRLGGDTRLDVRSVAAPAQAGPQGKKEVPLTVALPLMAVMLAAFVFYVMSLGEQERPGARLVTAGWFVGAIPLEPSLATCLETGVAQSNGPVLVPRDAPDALFRDYVAMAGTDEAPSIAAALQHKVSDQIATAHLLASEGRYADAAETLYRLENVIPVGRGDCPILSAARADHVTLMLQAQ